MDALRLDDGRIAVVNAGSQRVRIFAPGGEWLRDLGREGRGPGEFEMPAWTGVHGDTVMVWDLLARRLSRFAPDGRFAGSATVPDGVGHFPRMVGQYSDGSILLAADGATAGGKLGAVRDSMALLRVSPQGALLDTLAVVPASEQFASVSSDGRRFKVEDLPFGRRTVMALHEDVLYFGTGDDAGVRTMAADGTVRSLLSVPGAPARIGASDVDEYWAKLVTTGRSADAGDRQPTAGIPYPEQLPPHGPLHVDALGRVWVAESRLPRQWDEPASWWVFSPDGELLASIDLPPRSLVLQVGGDWILLREMDEDQREVVSLYRFSPDR